MRDHLTILNDAGGATKVAAALGLNLHTVRSWAQRGRIPIESFQQFVEAGLATMDELVATRRPRGEPKALPPQADAA